MYNFSRFLKDQSDDIYAIDITYHGSSYGLGWIGAAFFFVASITSLMSHLVFSSK